jgi:threonine dehydrogenase-like Zn-dependent dehydrogenase
MSREREIVFTGAREAALRPTDRPREALAADEVEGHTLVTLLSVGTEVAMYNGLFEHPFPLEPGYAAVFTVERVGDAVRSVGPGDLAFTMGPHRSFQRVPEPEVLTVPDGLAPETAVFCRMLGVPWTALTTTQARPPERVWVLGLGLVGHLAAKLFAAAGHSVLAYDPRAERRQLLAGQHGIELTSDLAEAGDAERGSVALVVECSGSAESVLDGCRAVRPNGEVVLVGGPWQERSGVDAAALHRAVYRNYATLRSGWEWQLPTLPTADGRASMLGNMSAALEWLTAGRIAISQDVYRVREPAAEVYDLWSRSRMPGLTTLFDWSDAETD